jgi:hypothetical protein
MYTKVTTLAVLAASVLIRIVRPDEFTTRRQRHATGEDATGANFLR